MTSKFNHNRSGTNQSQRNLDALSPDYFLLEERSITDLIIFAKKHAEMLNYYDLNNRLIGNWSTFLEGDPKEMAEFLNDPSSFDAFPEKRANYSRPHLVLFLVFLVLLKQSQSLVNDLTRKQLDFYFRQALRFSTKKAVADRVHILANIEDDETQVLIPKGTLLQAGVNAEGDPIEYSTDEELIADHSSVARLMSLFVEKEVTGISDLRAPGKIDKEKRFLSVLQLAYRKPGTTNSPRNYPSGASDEALAKLIADGLGAEDVAFDQKIIDRLDDVNKTITGTFKLRIAGFQRLMQDYHSWENKNTWEAINKFLLETYNRRKETDFKNWPDIKEFKETSETFDPRDFDANFEIALGFSVNGISRDSAAEEGEKSVFDGIPDVNNIYDLYRKYLNDEEDTDAETFIKIRFILETYDIPKFAAFMENRIKSLRYLKNIYHYLKAATIEDDTGSWDHFYYEKNKTLSQAFSGLLGVKTFVDDQGFVDLEKQLVDLEKYFRMSAEEYFFIRRLYQAESATDVPKWKWEKADGLLVRAYRSWLNKDQRDPDPKKELPKTNSDSQESKDKSSPVESKADITQRPEIVRWKNIYQAPDAKKILITSASADEPHPRWETFGAITNKNSDPKVHSSANLGWGISSPALALSEGIRELTLSLTFEIETFDAQKTTLFKYLNTERIIKNKDPYPFRIEVSTEKGWVELAQWQSFEFIANQMKLVVSANEEIDPFAPLAEDSNGLTWPCLRLIVLKEDVTSKDSALAGSPRQVYDLFKGQSLEKLELGIKVTGLKNLLVQNKEGAVDPKKPFDIFGSIPELGDRVLITHPELAVQRLDSIDLHLEWKNLPKKGLTDYYSVYKNYGDPNPVPFINDDSFQVTLSLVEAYRRLSLKADPQLRLPLGQHKLFPKSGVENTIQSKDIPKVVPKNDSAYVLESNAKAKEDVYESDRYLEIELQPQDFLHNQYAAISQKLANASLQSSKSTTTSTDEGSTTTTTTFVPPAVLNEPFKPTVKSLHADYETSITIDWKLGLGSAEDRVAHIEPFGLHYLPNIDGEVPFLPDFENEGTLYIGLEHLHPAQNISFLFQLAEGSANPDLEPSKVAWSYLSKNEWIPLEKDQLLKDTTGGLLSSGLIEIHIPGNASLHHQRMPDGIHWIKAEVERFSGSLSDCIDIRTQAVSATWIDPGQVSDHLAQPLSPESITQTVEPVSGLSSITQPYSSFLGKTAEADEQLYRRASGRLRHKQRALTIWDYENLVLEEFPDIYRAKAISADIWGDDYPPGSVRIIVIPDIRKRKPFDPFEPKVPVVRLRKIQQFLQERAPAFANILVQNARFKYLQLRVAARFHDMNNFGFFAEKLNKELVEYLAPWAFDNSADIVFGGKIYPSVIVDFIENRPYVDYIDRPFLRLKQRDTRGSIKVIAGQQRKEEELISIDEPDVVVVSAHQHIIEYLALPQEASERIRQGIGFAKIEFDFLINKEVKA